MITDHDVLLEHPHPSTLERLASIVLSVLLTATLRRCWPILARNNQQALTASQVSSHTLYKSRTNFFLYIKAMNFASILGSSNLTPLFLFHSLLLVMEELGTRKQTTLEQLPQFSFPCKHLFMQKARR